MITINTMAAIAATTCFEFTGNHHPPYRNRFLKSPLDSFNSLADEFMTINAEQVIVSLCSVLVANFRGE